MNKTVDIQAELLKRHRELYSRWLESVEAGGVRGKSMECRKRLIRNIRAVNYWLEQGTSADLGNEPRHNPEMVQGDDNYYDWYNEGTKQCLK